MSFSIYLGLSINFKEKDFRCPILCWIKLSLFFSVFTYRKRLWKDAVNLYVTFLASAVELGARLPLKPSEGEG